MYHISLLILGKIGYLVYKFSQSICKSKTTLKQNADGKKAYRELVNVFPQKNDI